MSNERGSRGGSHDRGRGDRGTTRGNRPGGGRSKYSGNDPSWKGKYGRVQAAAWEQSGQEGVWYSLSLKRSYKDKQGEWQTSFSFGDGDIDDLYAALDDFAAYCRDKDEGGGRERTRDDSRTQDDGPPF